MKTKYIYTLFFIMILSLLIGCEGGGGSGTGGTAGYGTLTMDITDAKPFVEGGQPDELWLVIDEIFIHQSGSGWISPDLPQYPLEINLLAFYDGKTTQLVPPALIPEGNITQIRMVISEAYMVFYGNPDRTEPIDLDVPSGKLRTSKKCDYWMHDGDALHIIVHFDLSQSIVQTGVDEFKLKPVLKLFNKDLNEAATILGTISADSFIDEDPVVATVIYNGTAGNETYTKVSTAKEDEAEPTAFKIYWLVPLEIGESYTVEISNGFDTYPEDIGYADLGAVEEYPLNDGDPIVLLTPP